MKFLVEMKLDPERDISPYLEEEGARVQRNLDEGIFDSVYGLRDGRGAVLVLNAEDEAAAIATLGELPLVAHGMLTPGELRAVYTREEGPPQ